MIVKKQRIVFAYLIIELLLLNLAYIPFYMGRFGEILQPSFWGNFIQSPLFAFILFNLSWLLIVAFKGANEIYLSENHLKRFKHLTINILGYMGILSSLMLVFEVIDFEWQLLILPLSLFAVLNFLSFAWISKVFRSKIREQAFGSNLLIIGDGKSGREVMNFSKNNQHLGYGVLGYVVDEEGKLGTNQEINVLGELKDLGQILDNVPVHEMVITLPREEDEKIRHAIEEANYRGIRISMIQDNPEWMGHNFKDYRLGDLNIMQLRQTPLDDFKRFMLKKVFDTLFALAVLVLLSPVYLIIGLMIVIESGFPVFYTPTRKREAGMTFKCYKFRTMNVCDDPNAGTKSTVKDDPRLTKMGKFLRKKDLDELPQFFNVLKGEMSVVGPRPHRVHLKQDFRSVVQEYMVRHYVKPGITGWAQVNGWRGPTVTQEQKEERIKHDLWYIENWSFWLDVKIVFLTVFGKKTRKNAF
ncbi:MAG: exopolysaccharide biosynthesis polyprenyl glycosylphosphotransferase [Bacteroidia bacterium]|nr:exopolysaccharide biosynthesis polyprenyl glycosylphosphotransferase [Bacteroidia bacterium]